MTWKRVVWIVPRNQKKITDDFVVKKSKDRPEMRYLALRPSTIRYTQDSIAARFSEGSPHSGVPIGETLDNILTGQCRITDLPPMTVEMVNGFWYSSNCRRLWVLKRAEALGACTVIPVKQGLLNESQITTYNFGKAIKVRGDPGGKYWRKMEKSRFKKPLKLFGGKIRRSVKGFLKYHTREVMY